MLRSGTWLNCTVDEVLLVVTTFDCGSIGMGLVPKDPLEEFEENPSWLEEEELETMAKTSGLLVRLFRLLLVFLFLLPV